MAAATAGPVLIATLALPAGHAIAESELRVTVLVDGQYEVGDQVVVSVAVTADELIDGEIVLTMRGRETSTRRDVQIAAGTTKEFYFALPTSWEEPVIDVSVRDGGDEVASETTRARQRMSGEVVGVLPRLAARLGELPGDVALGEGVGGATVAAVPVEVVDLGASALRAYDSIAAGADDLAELDGDQIASLYAWVSLGGILMLDDDAAAAELPDAWQPGQRGYAWADLGEVRFTEGEALAGHWEEIIQPTVQGTPTMFGGSEMMIDPQQDLARRAGLDLPSIAPLAVGIGVYALVLGPIVYLVLRRMRRLTLGWFVIPALAVVTAGGVAVAGSGAMRNGNPATATFIQESAAGAYALSNVLTFSDSGGRADVDIPSGWALSGVSDTWGGPAVPIEVVRNSDGSAVASVSLEATQANVRLYAGATRRVGLTTTAEWNGDREVTGTITNGTDATFRDVAVFAGDDEALIGDIAPGGSVAWTLSAVSDLRFAWETRGTAVWGDPFSGPMAVRAVAGVDAEPLPVAGGKAPAAAGGQAPTVEFGLWGSASMDLDLFPTGMVRVVGWTSEIPSGLISDDETSATTAVSSLAPIGSSGDRVGAATVRVVAVRNPFMGMAAPGNDQVFRYVLPADAEPDDLFMVGHGQLDIDELSFWDGATWIGADAEQESIPVPDEAIRDGVILVRTDVDMNQGPVGFPSITDKAPEENA